MKQWNSNLDLVRIFSALLVLSVHIAQWAGFEFTVGAKGVQLFFILSGFLTFHSLEREKTIDYYKKRIVRILPTYYFTLCMLYLLDAMEYIHSTGTMAGLFSGQCGIRFLRYVFFVHAVIPSNNYAMWNNHSALWTMSSFAFFYLLAPMYYKVFNKFYKAVSFLIILLVLRPHLITTIEKLNVIFPGGETHIEWFANENPFATLYCFMFGIVLFLAIKESKSSFLMMLFSGLLIVLDFECYKYELVFTMMLFFATQLPNIVDDEKGKRILKCISRGTFALYLIHPMVLRIAPVFYRKFFGRSASGVLYALYCYFTCFAISYFIYYVIVQKLEKVVQKIAITVET